jgi:uncharacterized protein
MLFKKVWKISVKVIMSAISVGVIAGITIALLKINLTQNSLLAWAGGLLLEVFNACLTLLYITGISLLMLKPNWLKRLTPLASIGKMALTTYLLQSLIGVFVFFNIGAGFFLVTTPGQNAILCLGIFGLQIIACRVWLNHFHYGPIEWLWRSATDLKWQPFRKI